ncbi:DHH family phosphoesterase [Paenibacillus caui]|uniref:DHH family phosphoesterase n=1 Tax=Paenibacillus caui TaxID=2873927 RepID=UPI001CA86650|nr:oligoribonuclease [Paenibacillus caui]
MYHIYTHNDLDGVGCGIIAKCAFGTNVEVRYNSLGGVSQQVERFLERAAEKGIGSDFLIITDLSVSEDTEQLLQAYAAEGGELKLIDHHKTALHYNTHPWGSVHVEHRDGRPAAATSLLYDYLIRQRLLEPTEALDDFVELVRLYDTWEWENAGRQQAKRLNDLFYMVSIDEFEEKMISRLQSGGPFEFDEFEKKLLDLEEDKIERYIRRKRRELVQTYIGKECAGIVHAESYHSELASTLGKDHPHLDYIAILNMGGRKMSLRTIHDDVDVSEIAGRYGGGGHAKASGCTMTEEVYRSFVAGTFVLEPLRPDAFRNRYNLKGQESGSLFESPDGAMIFVSMEDNEWVVEWNDAMLKERFGSFAEAERFLKRKHKVWLVRDDQLVKWLTGKLKRYRMSEKDE